MDAFQSRTSEPSTDISIKTYIKANSSPIVVNEALKYEEKLKTQKSAPSYFHSLKENEAPPFKRLQKDEKPHLLVGELVTEEDVVRMIAVADTETNMNFRKYLGDYLVDKNVVLSHNLSEKMFVVNLLLEAIDYSAQRDFNAFKLACLLTIYLKTHLYFKRYYWSPPVAVWEYFKETMIRHTVEDSPDGCEVFAPDESYDILTHFHTLYMCNIPLIHVLSFGVSRLKFTWPFKST
ncbi:unnamed protein product [Parnassius mnemosyne]|uniref:Uncharacterized protein n=1 Tax=Parnassius mnemosyne TaxID=213953 RepID=A0AAV1MAS9_9NEOP